MERVAEYGGSKVKSTDVVAIAYLKAHLGYERIHYINDTPLRRFLRADGRISNFIDLPEWLHLYDEG